MNKIVKKLINHETLSELEAKETVLEMMEGRVTSEEIGSILSIMQYRGETVEEIVGFAKGMREKSLKIEIPHPVLDTCGTGGDGSNTFNISTAVAILVSSFGIKVAKHGNRKVSSKTGSADVLEALGIPFQNDQESAVKRLEEYHLSFMFAPIYHEAMKNVGPVRNNLGVKTIFNLLGPLTNPANANKRIIGVYNQEAAKKMAEAALSLSIERALFVTGEDGLDELTINGKSFIYEVFEGKVNAYEITPEEVGLKSQSIDDAIVSSADESAELIRAVFKGNAPQAATDLVILNSAAALYVSGNVSSIKEGVLESEKAIGEQVTSHLKRLASKVEEGM